MSLFQRIGNILYFGACLAGGYYLSPLGDDYNISCNPSDWFPVTRIDKKAIIPKTFAELKNHPVVKEKVGSEIVSYKPSNRCAWTKVNEDDFATIFSFNLELITDKDKDAPTPALGHNREWVLYAEVRETSCLNVFFFNLIINVSYSSCLIYFRRKPFVESP
jgi:hypothetical protein